ncbi:MAG: metallophosphoesterase [Pyrinomonadaceae bacterium]
MSQQTIVIGDIHGCFDELRELLDRVALASEDRVVSVGDLIVKGPKNREVLDMFIDHPRCFSAVIGNHDLALRTHWQHKRSPLKPAQRRVRDELETDKKRYASYLQSLPLLINLEKHLIVHAGIRPSVSLEKQSTEDLTELRTLGPDRTSRDGPPWYEEYRGEKTVLFGHWPAAAPRRGPQALGIDTGCVYGYSLTAYIIESDKLISVKARRRYDAS